MMFFKLKWQLIMKTTTIRAICLFVLIGLNFSLRHNYCVAAENEANNKQGAIILSAGYIGDIFSNFHGGIKTGQGYLGLINFGLDIQFEQAGLWTGGELFIEFQNTHGALLSADYVGDMQVASNIDNGDYSYLFQLWYRQTLGNLSLTLGRHDLNAEFMASDFGGEYINSSFGIMGLAPINMPVSIFPKTGLGAIAAYDITGNVSIKSAIYDGDPLDLERDRYSLDFRVGSDESFLAITEVEVRNESNRFPGVYKAGFFHHNGDFLNMEDTTTTIKGNTAIYLLADQILFKENASDFQGLGVMAQIGLSPQNLSINDTYLALGMNYYGLFPGRDDEVMGIALAHASISNAFRALKPGTLGHETAIEFTYKYHLTDNITIQPDLQYIMNPAGSGSIENAFLGIMRIQLEY